MECNLALIADYAAMDAGGKLNVVGAFTEIRLQSVPGTLSGCCIVAMFQGAPIEAGQNKQFKIAWMTNDHHTIFEQEFDSQMPVGVEGKPIKFNIIIQLQNVEFTEVGPSRIYFVVNGEPKRDVGVEIVQLPPSPETT